MMRDEAVTFGANGNLIGVLTMPERPSPARVGVILMNAGLIHRVGPGRLYVRLARELAKRGHASLRFDFSTVGDSPPRRDQSPLLELVAREPAEAMDALAARGYENFVLLGVCSGAYAAYRGAAADARATAAILVNPQEFVGGEDWNAASWARRYWRRSLFSGRAWRNLFTGRVNYERLRRTLANQLKKLAGGGSRETAQQAENVRATFEKVRSRGQTIQFILSNDDVSVEQVSLLIGRDARAAVGSKTLGIRLIEDADHLFSREEDKAAFIDCACRCVDDIAARASIR